MCRVAMIELCRALARCGDSWQEASQDAGVAILRLHTLYLVSRQLFERHR